MIIYQKLHVEMSSAAFSQVKKRRVGRGIYTKPGVV